MGKAHRGRPLKEETPLSGRGTCPVTGRHGVKLLYEQEIDGKKVMVSKAGKATLANAKRRQEQGKKASALVATATAVAERDAVPEPEVAAVEEPQVEDAAAEETAAEEPKAEEAAAEAPAAEDAAEEPKAEEAAAEDK